MATGGKTAKKTSIRKCKLCGEEMPDTALFKHWKDKHPDFWRQIHSKAGRKSKAKAVAAAKIAAELTAAKQPKATAEIGAAVKQPKTETTKPQSEAKIAEVKEEQQIPAVRCCGCPVEARS